MRILFVESEYESSDNMEDLYNFFTDAEVDLYTADELDFEGMKDDYDVVLSEIELGYELRGPDVLDRFNADTRALYTVWDLDDARGEPEVAEAFERYEVITKPGPIDLEQLIEENL